MGTFIHHNQNSSPGFSILQWNARSLKANGDEFKSFLDSIDYQPDVICVQETFFKEDTLYSFPNYTLIQKCGDGGHGGVAFLINKKISYSSFEKLDDIEGISVKIQTSLGLVEVVNLYLSPNAVFSEQILENILNKEKCIICGDFNAKSALWGSPRGDSRGRILEGLLENCDKVVLNTGAPTRVYNSGESHIDLTFSSSCFSSLIEWEVLDKNCGSDHSIVSMEVGCTVNYDNTAVPKWVFNKADWGKFTKNAERYLNNVDFNQNLEDLSDDITDAMYLAAKEAIPMSRVGD